MLHYPSPVPRRNAYPADLRDRLVAAAAERLSGSDPRGLSLRSIASSEGTSTNAVYSIFGGKDGLIGAVLADAAASFLAAQEEALGSGETLDDLKNLGVAYRAWALSNPTLYRVMFGARGLTHAGPPGPDAAAPLKAGVTQLMANGALCEAPVDLVCHSMWASVHGWVMLEISGAALPEAPDRATADQRFSAHLDFHMDGLRTP